MRLDPGVQQRAIALYTAAKAHRRSDKTLHQEPLRRAYIGLVHIDPGAAQALGDVHQLGMLAAVEADHRARLKITQRQLTPFDIALVLQQSLGLAKLNLGDKRGAGLVRQAHLLRPVIGGQPEVDLDTRRRITPVPGQDKALPQVHYAVTGMSPASPGGAWQQHHPAVGRSSSLPCRCPGASDRQRTRRHGCRRSVCQPCRY